MKKIVMIFALSAVSLPAFAANLFVNGDFEDIGTLVSPTYTQGYGAVVTAPGGIFQSAQNVAPKGWSVWASGWDFNTASHPNTSPDLLSFAGVTNGVTLNLDHYQNLTFGTSVLNESTGFHETPVFANGVTEIAGITQTVALNVGGLYEISFSLAEASSNPGLYKPNIGLEIWIDGALKESIFLPPGSSPYSYQNFTYQFSAGAGNHEFSFRPTVEALGAVYVSTGALPSSGVAAGTVSLDNLTLSPIPEPSIALLGSLGVLGLLRRRR